MPAPYIGSYGALGYAKEVTFGTPVAAAKYFPFDQVSIDKDPGLFDIKLARQQRELTTYVGAGEQKITGKIDGSLFALMGMQLLVGAIGTDQYQVGSSASNATTLSAPTSAGATNVNLTSATGYTVGGYIQLDTATTSNAEVRKITAVTANVVTVDSGLTYGHAINAPVYSVSAPFSHAIAEANSLPSFTIEKNLGGLTSVQYAGAVIDKFTVKGATKNEVKVSLDVIAQKDAQISTTTPTYTSDSPFVLAGVTTSLMGSSDSYPESFQLDLANNIKALYTFSGERYPTFLTPTGRKVTMKITESLQSMTYYNDLAAANQLGTPPAGQNTITCNAGSDQVVFTLPQVSISKLSMPIKVGDVIMCDLEFEAWLGTNTNSLTATVWSQQYLPY